MPTDSPTQRLRSAGRHEPVLVDGEHASLGRPCANDRQHAAAPDDDCLRRRSRLDGEAVCGLVFELRRQGRARSTVAVSPFLAPSQHALPPRRFVVGGRRCKAGPTLLVSLSWRSLALVSSSGVSTVLSGVLIAHHSICGETAAWDGTQDVGARLAWARRSRRAVTHNLACAYLSYHERAHIGARSRRGSEVLFDLLLTSRARSATLPHPA
jgi:hypothetical protein